MDSQTLIMIIAIAISIGLAAIGLGLFVFLRQKPAGTETASLELSELRGQLTQLAQLSQQQQQGHVEQMASLSKRLEESLAGMSARMGNSLQEQTEKTHKNLSDLAARLAVIDAANAKIGELTGQVTQLHNILANKTDRGAFGEVQLENLVRNVLPPNAYEFQVQLSNGRRADCLLKLPNPPGDIIIDAKFPLEAWHQMQNAKDENGRKAARKQLGMDVLKHVKDIQERYIITGETAESACLFLPSEAVYAELHANMLDVVEKSYDARVWIVSPTTMMATLNTVRAILKDARMREQTALIQKEIGMLVGDVTRLDKRVDNLGKHFDLAQKDVQEIKTSTGKISNRGRRIEDYDVESDEVKNVVSSPQDLLSASQDTNSD
ncbi:MAG: DNA recombination protein RmuC [Pseudomonadota bacterium]|nr:DNA recombination protein RmuC [Pseudomonadota bacterium]